MTDEQHGWRVVALYSWQADHLIDEETGDPTDEWYDAITDFDMQQTDEADDPIGLLHDLTREMKWKIRNPDEQGCKLLSITISLTQVPIHRSDGKPGNRSVKRRRAVEPK
jgi:hypothetical protein